MGWGQDLTAPRRGAGRADVAAASRKRARSPGAGGGGGGPVRLSGVTIRPGEPYEAFCARVNAAARNMAAGAATATGMRRDSEGALKRKECVQGLG